MKHFLLIILSLSIFSCGEIGNLLRNPETVLTDANWQIVRNCDDIGVLTFAIDEDTGEKFGTVYLNDCTQSSNCNYFLPHNWELNDKELIIRWRNDADYMTVCDESVFDGHPGIFPETERMTFTASTETLFVYGFEFRKETN